MSDYGDTFKVGARVPKRFRHLCKGGSKYVADCEDCATHERLRGDPSSMPAMAIGTNAFERHAASQWHTGPPCTTDMGRGRTCGQTRIQPDGECCRCGRFRG